MNGLAAALGEALQGEYRARARYAKVLGRFGPVGPFPAIAAAEQRHIDALLALFRRYRVPVPPDTWPARLGCPPALAAACQAGVVGEIDNVALYDRLLHWVSAPDVRQTFLSLQRASREAHLPTFQRCLARLAATPPVSIRETKLGCAFVLGIAFGATLAYLLTRRVPFLKPTPTAG